MIRARYLPMVAACVLLSATFASGDVELRSPGSVASKVSEDGTLVEPWGAIRLQIVEPEGARVKEQSAEQTPMPMAVTRIAAGPVTLTESAYRAPVWPSGVDVLEAVLCNSADKPAKVQLELVIPEEMQVGESTGTVNGKPSLILPGDLEPVREEREWGCTGGVSALPGWAKPKDPCDPAFRNIAAGMGGMPITYRFTVEPGSKRTAVLGFCESYHSLIGRRPVVVEVEGADERSIDPLEVWGQHIPGVSRFDAVDSNGDGRLEITVAPHPEASDRNPILNVLWLFKPATRIDDRKLVAGELNDRAEHYVDVGGERDQGLYKPGNLKYVLRLEPQQERELLFLVRSPDCRYLPDMTTGLWNKSTLRKAAADVWRDRWDETASAKE